MKQPVNVFFISMIILTFVIAQNQNKKDPDQQVKFETYYMVLLQRGPQAAEISEEQLQKIQRGHLGHLTWLQEQGYAYIAGPFEVSADYPLRGVVIYRGDLEMQKVKELAERDPAVKSGRLQVEILKWWVPAGKLAWKQQTSLQQH